ncbi:MAG: hypothetical protein MI862_26670 [Desulfobacterales bacterium]|nr:hypothetical protein [Desulfobacterales bacterium]
MIQACNQFLIDQISRLAADKEAVPYTDENIFIGPMPRDFLKTHPFAACCLTLQDTKKKSGKLVSNIRSDDFTYYTRTFQRFERQITYRVLLYAAGFGDQWGQPEHGNFWDMDVWTGLVDQLEQRIAGTRFIPDENNMAIRVEALDAIRPWNTDEARQRVKRKHHKAIVRVVFTGGIYTTQQVPIVGDVNIQPEYT